MSRSRGRGNSTCRSAMMRPGRALMQKMRSARKVASRRSWVTRMIVTFARNVQVAHDAPQLLASEAVEGTEGLIQQQLRFMDESAAQRGTLLHTARQLPGE